MNKFGIKVRFNFLPNLSVCLPTHLEFSFQRKHSPLKMHRARNLRQIEEFSNSAKFVLERRVKNSDPSKNERKWLAGWLNRCNTYKN